MKRLQYLILAIGLFATSSCGFLDRPAKVIESGNFYQTREQAQYGLNAVYGALNNREMYGVYIPIKMMLVDDMCLFVLSMSTEPMYIYTFDASTAEIYDVWVELYKAISNANYFLREIAKTDFDQDGQMAVQARFLRAYYHFLVAELWGDAPLCSTPTDSYDKAKMPASSQLEILQWVEQEMKWAIENSAAGLDGAPTKVTRPAMQGILARVYLYMAGAVSKATDEQKHGYLKNAMDLCKVLIDDDAIMLNPDYSQIFKNYISDIYDVTYHESLWEVDFIGDRSSADKWTEGRHGEVNGLRSTGGVDYSLYRCNYSSGFFGNTLRAWDMYMSDDRTPNEKDLKVVTDKRQEWNLPPYNYQGKQVANFYPYGGDPSDIRVLRGGIDRAPYGTSIADNTNVNPLSCPASRNTGKFRREVEYQGVSGSKEQYNSTNYPLLRYADVLLMYAEASNEYNGHPTYEAYDAVKQVRDRAGIETKEFSEYDYESFRDFVRNERGRELAFEGVRKMDLIRWGIFVREMNRMSSEYGYDTRWNNSLGNNPGTLARSLGDAVMEKHVLYPIPLIELGVNDMLRQNPQW